MIETPSSFALLRHLTWPDVISIFAVLALASLIVIITRWATGSVAEKLPPRLRMFVLRAKPIIRLLISIIALAIIVPIIIEPSFNNLIILFSSVALLVGFAFKDYGSSLIAGVIAVFENTYQPGDWIEIDGAYGEVKTVGMRAVHIVTLNDTEVIIPHSRLWSKNIFNATSGNHSLLCVTDFYLHPEHDAGEVRRRLAEIAKGSEYLKPETSVAVTVKEKPWGTHYRLKAYVKDSREQTSFTTDLTVRGKAALTAMDVRFAQATYAEPKNIDN